MVVSQGPFCLALGAAEGAAGCQPLPHSFSSKYDQPTVTRKRGWEDGMVVGGRKRSPLTPEVVISVIPAFVQLAESQLGTNPPNFSTPVSHLQ